MLNWKILNNVISELYLNGKNIIYPWGFETADSSSFFSLENGVGWRSKKLFENYTFNNLNYEADLITKMQEGKWQLSVQEMIVDNSIYRKIEANTLEDCFFMDFVMRFRFRKEFIEYAEISNKKYLHNNTNVYYQFPVNNVYLKGKGFNVSISIEECVVPNKMEPVIYVRDFLNEWVVHVRMVPKEWDKEVIKICTDWAGTRPLPQFISKPLLLFSSIKKNLWYRGERSPFKNRFIKKFVNPSAFGMVKVPKNSVLSWNVKVLFS